MEAHTGWWRKLTYCALVCLLLAGGTPATAQQATVAAHVDWPHFGNTGDQHRYSTLDQIDTTTIRRLGVAWTLPEGAQLNLWEDDPVVVDGKMYVTTGTGTVLALHADTGKVIWRYTPEVNFIQFLTQGIVTPVNRGVEVARGTVFFTTIDDQLIALDAATGTARWSARVADPQQGYMEGTPPTYWRGLLFIGSAGGDSGARGFIAAYNARNGRQVWRFYTVPARGAGWVPAAGAHGGGDVWMPVTVDAGRGILYAGTGNPSPDLVAEVRPGCNPWTDAVVALKASTGALLWGRTLVCPDRWDYDADQTPLLLTTTIRGRRISTVGEGTKNGRYWLLDTRGHVIAESPPLTPQSSTPIGTNPKSWLVCPGKLGGLEYSPPAYSPRTGAIYLPGIDMCMIYRASAPGAARKHQAGRPDLGGEILPTTRKPRGFLAALRADTLAVLWRKAMPAPLIGGALATAGDLVFSGADDGRFYAFDARTGTVRWSARIGLGFGAAPITYAVHGVQYIAIAAGGSGVAAYTGAPVGGTLFAFRLGGRALPR